MRSARHDDVGVDTPLPGQPPAGIVLMFTFICPGAAYDVDVLHGDQRWRDRAADAWQRRPVGGVLKVRWKKITPLEQHREGLGVAHTS